MRPGYDLIMTHRDGYEVAAWYHRRRESAVREAVRLGGLGPDPDGSYHTEEGHRLAIVKRKDP